MQNTRSSSLTFNASSKSSVPDKSLTVQQSKDERNEQRGNGGPRVIQKMNTLDRFKDKHPKLHQNDTHHQKALSKIPLAQKRNSSPNIGQRPNTSTQSSQAAKSRAIL